MADKTDTTNTALTTDTTATGTANEAVPTSVTATHVDTSTLADTATPVASSSFPATTSSDNPALITPSSTSSRPSTSSTTSISSASNPFPFPPFFTGTDRPPFPSGSPPPFFFHDQSNGLSTGAKAGIGVGVAALALSVFAVALLILRMRKKEQMWAANTAPPPTYEESNVPDGSAMEMMRPKPAMKHVPPPLLLSQPGSSSGSPVMAPVAARSSQRKSKASIRPRRNSNLAPVSEEEAEATGTNLALVYEDGDDGSSTNAPPTPRTPRTAALHALTGDSGAPSPMGSSFNLEPVPPLPGDNFSPVSSDFEKSGKSRR